MKLSFGSVCGAAIVGASLIVSTVQAETRVTYKSAKSTSSYYQMAVNLRLVTCSGMIGSLSPHSPDSMK